MRKEGRPKRFLMLAQMLELSYLRRTKRHVSVPRTEQGVANGAEPSMHTGASSHPKLALRGGRGAVAVLRRRVNHGALSFHVRVNSRDLHEENQAQDPYVLCSSARCTFLIHGDTSTTGSREPNRLNWKLSSDIAQAMTVETPVEAASRESVAPESSRRPCDRP